MRQYRAGFCEALDRVAVNTLAQNLRLIDDLEGRRSLASTTDDEAVREEARRQIEREFRAAPLRSDDL